MGKISISLYFIFLQNKLYLEDKMKYKINVIKFGISKHDKHN